MSSYQGITNLAKANHLRPKLTFPMFYITDPLGWIYKVGVSIARLRDDIRLDVKIKQPQTIADAIGVARLVEE
ncbi:hypothetical protein FEM48_Zijuj06G0147400 [Ziziphus jujuba var. spinosa]|uniref:Uncharacterized protein n=1 Tax=Ziziphus jujuba var. spinosa TaxID=714518 RepID=A0A978V9W5_ZIZJJ|nr:hypothetical protein FEM48_Zijuj06G0147400 [Ziziphus jujuba var. spinosa]